MEYTLSNNPLYYSKTTHPNLIQSNHKEADSYQSNQLIINIYPEAHSMKMRYFGE